MIVTCMAWSAAAARRSKPNGHRPPSAPPPEKGRRRRRTTTTRSKPKTHTASIGVREEKGARGEGIKMGLPACN
jgi:hypothetical protein